MLYDTIAAIATPHGRSGIGVLRISGSNARTVAEALVDLRTWPPRLARTAQLLDSEGRVFDHVLVTFFAAPASYTGEDVVEISCHGSPVILRHALDRACTIGAGTAAARLANPGEFSLRAFLNGRLDLPRAEAIRDLIESTTLYQARVAAQQAAGALSRRIQPIKAQLLELIALLEAGIDFAEDDISVAPTDEILRRIQPVHQQLTSLVASFQYGRLVNEGFSLAIVGRPNAGKSSLFNQLIQQDRAIVTDIPGTTRDTVSETSSIAGIPVRFIDTAGIRQGQDLVETLGIERSYQAIADADLTLCVIDLSTGEAPLALDAPHLVVGNKCDLASGMCDVSVSALTGQGIPELREAILHKLAPEHGHAEGAFLTSLRHKQSLERSVDALAKATLAARAATPHEMLLLDLYDALRGIDELTGATTADDILNRIFSTFCIGK